MKNLPSLGIPRVIGYSLMLLTLMNWGDILFPPRFMDPLWELETVGSLVESIPLVLFALVLILYGENQYRNKLEQVLLKILSQGCIFLAVVFFLLVPIAANSTIRISQDTDRQIGDVFGVQMDQIDQLEAQLDEASNQEVIAILESQGLDSTGPESDIAPKDQLLEYLAETRSAIQSETNDTKQRRKRALFKNAFKWSMGAIISSFTFGYLWVLTRWARELNLKPMKKG